MSAMGVLKESLAGLKPVIYVAWIVAAARILAEALTTDLNVVAMLSVYAAIAVMFLFAGFTGQLDRLVWKPLLLGALVLGIACWFIPSTIAYGVAQFQGWDHGRFGVTRGPPISDTTAGKLQTAVTVAFFTSIAGTLWSLVLGVLFVGIPAAARRRRLP
jgi:hypothetical protein